MDIVYKHIDHNSYSLAEYDYNSYTSGEGYETRTHITDGKITKVNYDSIQWTISNNQKIRNIRDYCLDRYIRRNININSFEFDTTVGYYGDEPCALLERSDAQKINKFIDLLNDKSKTDSSFVELVLIEEYGFILDELKNKEWKFEKIKLNDIIVPTAMRHTQKEMIGEYIKILESNKELTCVCQKIGNKFRLIDGYHRYSAAKQLNKTKIITIYCE